ncbi:MAG: hypothetical protein AB1715_02720 [Acidobacteriota bacterium]
MIREERVRPFKKEAGKNGDCAPHGMKAMQRTGCNRVLDFAKRFLLRIDAEAFARKFEVNHA